MALNARRGSVAFLLAALIPIFFLLGVLVFELNSIMNQRQMAQELVDGASLLAAHTLPFSKLAQQKALSYLAQYGVGPQYANCSVDGSDVIVNYRARAHLTFTKFFEPLDGLEIPVASKATLVPHDVVIYLDVSSYMAPSVFNSQGVFVDNRTAWGEVEVENEGEVTSFWPTGDFFRKTLENRPFFPDPHDPDKLETDAPRRILTQQCFNPALSALKEAALRLYDYFSSSPLNSVAVLAGPGGIDDPSAAPVSVIRSLQGRGALAGLSSEAVFPYFRSRYASDEYCLGAAENEAGHPGYRVPPPSSDLQYWDPGIRPEGLIDTDGNHHYYLPQANIRFISAREAIWSLAVRRTYPDFAEQHWIASISDVITYAGGQLLAAAARPERGTLTANGSHSAFILLGNVPYENGVRFDETVQQAMHRSMVALNRRAHAAGVKLDFYFSFFKHPGSYPECQYSEWGLPTPCSRFASEAEAFQTFLGEEKFTSLSLHFLRVPDVSSLPQDYVSLAALIGKSAVLKR